MHLAKNVKLETKTRKYNILCKKTVQQTLVKSVCMDVTRLLLIPFFFYIQNVTCPVSLCS